MNQDPYQTPVAPAAFQQSEGYISQRAAWELLGTQGWVRFVSICIFIGSGLLLISSISMLSFSSSSRVYDSSYSRTGSTLMILPSIMMAVVCLLYIYPAVLLAKYASAIRRFRYTASMADLEAALRHQRFVWRFIGIIFIIGIGLFLLSFLMSLGSRF